MTAELLELEDSPEAVLAEFCKREWCDGLPFVPPTPERVRAMVAATRLAPTADLGLMPPLWRDAVVEKLAVNAVMAGCEPAYFPVVVAAVQCMLDPSFNLYGVQATTHPVAPLVVVSPRLPANEAPMAAETRVAHCRFCLAPHRIDRRMRPPSRGKPGIRLKKPRARLIQAR